MSDDHEATLQEMLVWVNEHAAVPEIGLFLQSFGQNRGMTITELAEQEPDEALELCEALFWMIEDDYSPEQLHDYFKKNQPERRRDKEIFLG